MHHTLVVNSYPDPPLSEIMYVPLYITVGRHPISRFILVDACQSAKGTGLKTQLFDNFNLFQAKNASRQPWPHQLFSIESIPSLMPTVSIALDPSLSCLAVLPTSCPSALDKCQSSCRPQSRISGEKVGPPAWPPTWPPLGTPVGHPVGLLLAPAWALFGPAWTPFWPRLGPT